jgi:hypothetical protein
MQCLLALLALATPRLVIVLVVVFSDWLGSAYNFFLWPLLGFFFLPVTTLAYAWSIHTYGGMQGLGLVAVILAFLVDVGLIGSSRRKRRERQRK